MQQETYSNTQTQSPQTCSFPDPPLIILMQENSKQKRNNLNLIREKLKKQGIVPHLAMEPTSSVSHSMPEISLAPNTPLLDATPLTSHKKTFQEDFELKEKIGEGCNGVVRKCIDRKTGITYVVKISQVDDEQIIYLRKTFALIRKLNHQRIIKYLSMYFKLSQNKCYLVMDYVPFPSLRKYKHLPQPKIKNIVKQLLETIVYMHSEKICHRDLKLDNILYDEVSESVWVIDFGISKAFEDGRKRKEMLTNTGTIYYKAPEIFQGGGYNQSVDLWAMGVIIYELVTGYTPFCSESLTDTINRIIDIDYQFGQEWMKINKLARDLVSRLLKKKGCRLTAEEALKSPWMFGKKAGVSELLVCSGTFAFGYDDQRTKEQQDQIDQLILRKSSFKLEDIKKNMSVVQKPNNQKKTVQDLKRNDDDFIFSS